MSTCGLPLNSSEKILLAHGGGGRMMQNLIRNLFAKEFENSFLSSEHDAAILPQEKGLLAFTTDTYVVRPLFFAGGDIGQLAVYGTVNDLAMAGAKPLYLSLGIILEEGFPMETLVKIVRSIRDATQKCQVKIVTGDTKVVERGKGDGIFLNTSGIGVIEHSLKIQPSSIRNDDSVIVSGDLGRHGIAVMAERSGLEFETTIQSDLAPLDRLVFDLIDAGIEIHCLRDLTRGGLASALNEIAISAACHVSIEEKAVPVQFEVRGACEILGLDPLSVANEGRLVAFVPPHQTSQAIEIMRRHPEGRAANVIGKVMKEGSTPGSGKGQVTMKSQMGALRILSLPSGELLPRIC